MKKNLLPLVILALIPLSPVFASNAEKFMENYNATNSSANMTCVDNINNLKMNISAVSGDIFVNGTQLANMTKHTVHEQYYIKGALWDMLIDFDNKRLVLVVPSTSEELERIKCE